MVMMVDDKEHSRLHSVEAIITCLLSSNLCNKARKIDYSGGPGLLDMKVHAHGWESPMLIMWLYKAEPQSACMSSGR